MDVRQYADLFLSESRDHLTAYNHLLLEWEKDPAARESVGGIFRAVHTIKGMAATMGYAGVAEVAHRIENLLDGVRKGERAATPQVLDLLLRAGDVLEKGIANTIDGKAEAAPEQLLAELDAASGGPAARGHVPVAPSPAMEPITGEFAVPAHGSPLTAHGRVVRITLRAEASLKGARALIALRKARELGVVSALAPAAAAMEADTFDGRFSFRLETDADPARITQLLRAAGDVEAVQRVLG